MIKYIIPFILILCSSSAWALETKIDGYGSWKFGMTKSEVKNISQHAPYNNVQSTGGLETQKGNFNTQTKNISFVFDDKGLRKIQIWVYTGNKIDEAIAAWGEVHQYLSKTFGPVEFPGMTFGTLNPTQEQKQKTIKEQLNNSPQNEITKLQMGLITMPEGGVVFSSLVRHPEHGYYVFLYFVRK